MRLEITASNRNWKGANRAVCEIISMYAICICVKLFDIHSIRVTSLSLSIFLFIKKYILLIHGENAKCSTFADICV